MPSSARRPQLLRARVLLLIVAGALMLGALGAPVAVAAEANTGNAFSELSSGASSEQSTSGTKTTTTTKTSTETSTGTSSKVLIIALVAAVVLLSAIAFVIVRDARRLAPASEADLVEAESRTVHDTAVKQRKRRAKAKAARKQRKRTR